MANKWSLYYRRNTEAIRNGNPPEKYTRLLSFTPESGEILEIGSAEGVLALLMAERGANVTAIEKSGFRHNEALDLQEMWLSLDKSVSTCEFLNINFLDNLELLEGKDVLVAVRTIYYFREKLNSTFFEIAKHVPTVVLCGNLNREKKWNKAHAAGSKDVWEYDKYACADGMKEILEINGYSVTAHLGDHDPIVIGTLNV